MLNVKLPDISLLPKEYTVKAPLAKMGVGLSAILFIILFLVLASWGGLYFYKNQLRDEVDILNDKIKEVPIQGRESDVAKINDMGKKIANLKDILDNHIFASNIFKEVENFTLKKVYFNEFNVDTQKSTLHLSGVADSYTTFAKQFSELNNIKESGKILQKVDSESMKFSKDGVEFGFNLTLYADIFKKVISPLSK